MKAEQFDTCLLCGSHKLRTLIGYETNFLVQCNNCHFVFCQRKPTSLELTEHYLKYTRANFISPITINRYEELLEGFEKFRKSNNIIDVGCGDGYFLEAAKKRNWNVYGTEFTEEAIALCKQKGIDMQKGTLNTNHYTEGFFDVITSFEVIEHINNPLPEVKAFHNILRVGGLVYVTTPNFNSISRNFLGPSWNIIEYPEHLSYYTKKTLTNLFRSFKFQLLDISTTGISINRIKRSNSSSASSSAVNHDEAIREKAEKQMLFRWIKIGINLMLNLFSKGDAIKASFIKL